MDSVMKKLSSRRRAAPPNGAVLLEDGKKFCESVMCTRGALVKDVIDEVCKQEGLQIVPIARQFFALCDPKTGLPLCPYHTLTQEEAKKKYQLRVFVNTGENSFQFLRMSKAAYRYYYCQLKEEFVNDRLYPRASVNTGIWMAAIDMAREAHGTDSNYTDIIHNPRDLLKFMPKFLKDRCTKKPEVDEKLRDTFKRFKDIRKNVAVDHYESKYVEVYEKDAMCGNHIFRLKTTESRSKRHSQPLLAVVSSKEGIYKVRMNGSGNTKEQICTISCLTKIAAESSSITLALCRRLEDGSEQETEETTLDFFDKKEAHSFAVLVHTYYQLLANANEVILAGELAPREEFLRVGFNAADGKKVELCHAPIPPQFVSNTLSNHGAADGMCNGNFLIRESRNTDNAYTLSVWNESKVMNYRIIYKEGVGYSFQDPQSEEGEPGPSHQIFSTLVELINHHSEMADGLPAVLKMNYTPKITGPIPLLKRLTDNKSNSSGSLVSHSNSGHNSSDEDYSDTSTPTTSTPFSLSSPHNQFTGGGGGDSAVMTPTSTVLPPTMMTALQGPTTGAATSQITPIAATTTSSSSSPSPVAATGTTANNSSHNSGSGGGSPPNVESDLEESLMPADPLARELIHQGVRFIDYGALKTLKELGSGHYSTVYLAEWVTEKSKKVAVKIPSMKEDNVEAVKKDLMREIGTMNTLKHDHIVQLLGISSTKHYLDYIGVIPVVIMEFVDGGCLRSFLNDFRRNQHLMPDLVSKTKRDFVLYGKQIAEGMNYLAKNKIIHRDLAARNVLLVSNDHVKISDFGLARKQREESDYYTSKGSSNDLPIYWYSPECLSSFKFTTKGDVWSYGVTLWEMFTLGDNPNAHLGRIVHGASSVQMAFQSLVELYTKHHKRLPNVSCDKRVYSSILMKCWDLDPYKRPSFEELAKEMGDLYNIVNAAKNTANAAATPAASAAAAATSPSSLSLQLHPTTTAATTTTATTTMHPTSASASASSSSSSPSPSTTTPAGSAPTPQPSSSPTSAPPSSTSAPPPLGSTPSAQPVANSTLIPTLLTSSSPSPNSLPIAS